LEIFKYLRSHDAQLLHRGNKVLCFIAGIIEAMLHLRA